MGVKKFSPAKKRKKKRCYFCGKRKLLTDFGLNRAKPDGRGSECRICARERGNKNYQKNKTKVLSKKQQHYRDNKAEIAAKQRQYYSNNKAKFKRRSRARYLRNRESCLARERKRRHGITAAQYTALLASQGHVCAICRRPETLKKHNGRVCQLSVDHDHKTGQIRGLLCSRCNCGLGWFGDNIDSLQQAIFYLAEHNGRN